MCSLALHHMVSFVTKTILSSQLLVGRDELSLGGGNRAPPTYVGKVLSSTKESSSRHTFRVWGLPGVRVHLQKTPELNKSHVVPRQKRSCIAACMGRRSRIIQVSKPSRVMKQRQLFNGFCEVSVPCTTVKPYWYQHSAARVKRSWYSRRNPRSIQSPT